MGDAIKVLGNSGGSGLRGETLLGLVAGDQKVRDSGNELIRAWENVWCVYAAFVVVELAVSFSPPLPRSTI